MTRVEVCEEAGRLVLKVFDGSALVVSVVLTTRRGILRASDLLNLALPRVVVEEEATEAAA